MNKKAESQTETLEKQETVTFSKDQLVASDKFASSKDLLSALLAEGKTYSITEVEKIISDHMKKEVK